MQMVHIKGLLTWVWYLPRSFKAVYIFYYLAIKHESAINKGYKPLEIEFLENLDRIRSIYMIHALSDYALRTRLLRSFGRSTMVIPHSSSYSFSLEKKLTSFVSALKLLGRMHVKKVLYYLGPTFPALFPKRSA